MKKRIPAAFLALALCLGLAVPACAVEIENALRSHIKDTFTIMRNGTVDETKGVYTSSREIWLDLYYDWAAGGPTGMTYEVYDENDSWTITNTGSKTISAGGSTDYTLSFGFCQYGDDPWDDTDVMGEIGGSGVLGIDEDGTPRFVYGGPPDQPVILEVGESVTIPASSLGDSSPDSTIYELIINVNYSGETGGSCQYTIYFGYDPVEKAAIEKTIPAFTDVPDWCAPAVNWAVENQITNGKSVTRFAPNDPCTHAQILTFLWRAAGEQPAYTPPPVDITGKNLDWAADALGWAVEMDMIDGSLDPTAPCTRGDAVVYIWKAFGEMGADGWDGFVDITPDGAGETLYGAVSFAVCCGIANGYDNGDGTFSFRPDKVCSRGEIVTLLHRAYVPEAGLRSD